VEEHWTRDEALKTTTFWVFALGDFMTAGLGTGLLFHHFSLMSANGLDRVTATEVFLPLGLMTALFNILAGIALDRYQPRHVLAVALGCLVAALGLGGLAHSAQGVLVYGVALGATIGIASSVTGVALPHHFGRMHLGSIKGVSQTCFIAGTAIGPVPFALAFQYGGSYWGAIFGSMVLALSLMALALLHQPAQRNR
jgi:MFS family permease